MRIEGIPVVPETTKNRLTERELADYRDHRTRLIRWIIDIGKDPEHAVGYAEHTSHQRAYRIDAFYRWVWDEEGRYTTQVTHGHADGWMRQLARQSYSADHKANLMKAVKMLFRWRAWELGDEEWEPEIKFSNDTSTTNPRDYFTKVERARVREAALEYGSIPHYNSLSPGERDEWQSYLAQRFGKTKDQVGKDDFDRANGWKYPTLIWTSLDAGLRPVEVSRATVHWVDTDNRVLRIPKEESSKNRDNWVVGLTERTTTGLDRWLQERRHYDMYDGSDQLWLTREANPYESHSLNHVLHRLCDIADIDTEHRDVTWYSIRHSVGTYMTREEGLAAAQAQLRHKSEKTTMKYDQAPVEDRRDALDRMG